MHSQLISSSTEDHSIIPVTNVLICVVIVDTGSVSLNANAFLFYIARNAGKSSFPFHHYETLAVG